MSNQKSISSFFLGIFLFYFALYLFTYRGLFSSIDELVMYSMAESLVRQGSFETPQRLFAEFHHLPSEVVYEPINSLLAAVPLALMNLYLGIGNEHVVMLLSPIYTALTVGLLVVLLEEMGVSRGSALAVGALYGLGGMAWPYSRTFYREPLLGLVLIAAFYFLVRYHRSHRRRDGVLALALALCSVGVKAVAVIAVPVFGLALLVLAPEGERRRWIWGGLVVLLIASGVVLVARGNWSVSLIRGILSRLSLGPEIWTAAYGLTLSPGKGILWYSPAVVFGVGGLVLWRKRWRMEAVVIVSLAIAFVGIYSFSGGLWWGGTNWGPRYLLPVLPLLTLPAGVLLDLGGPWRWMRWGGLVVSTAIGFVAATADWGVYYTSLAARFPDPESTVLLELRNFSLSPVVGQFLTWRPENFDLLWLRPLRSGDPPVLHIGLLLTLFTLLGIALFFFLYLLRPRPWGETRKVLGSATLLFGSGILLFLHQAYTVPGSYRDLDTPSLRAIAKETNQAPGRKVLVSVSNIFQYNVIMNFLKGDLVHYWFSPVQEDGLEILSPAMEGSNRIFLVTDSILPNSENSHLERWLNGNAFRYHAEWIGPYVLFAYAPPQPIAVRKQGGQGWPGIRLRGFGQTALRVNPGDPLALEFTFQATEDLEQDYIFFVHLIRGDGFVLDGEDAPPQYGAAPTSTWAAGQLVQDRRALIIPPDLAEGEYFIEVGFTHGEERVPVLSGEGITERGTFVISSVYVGRWPSTKGGAILARSDPPGGDRLAWALRISHRLLRTVKYYNGQFPRVLVREARAAYLPPGFDKGPANPYNICQKHI